MARNPTNPKPARPRVKDAKAYEAAIRKKYLTPLFTNVESRMADVVAANQVWRVMDDIVGALAAKPHNGVPVEAIQQSIDGMNGYHRKKVIDTFRRALGVDIRPLLTEPAINAFMNNKVTENVNLIKTIPSRLHFALRANLLKQLEEQPFDQQMLKTALRDEFKSSGYNLRRITRDQTNKTIGGLTQVRQTQLGIESYQWITSQDERVRPSHVRNSGQIFEWGKPPSETGAPGDDTLCRCVGAPVVRQRDRERLTGASTHSITHISGPGGSLVSPPVAPIEAPKVPVQFWKNPEWRASRTAREIEQHETSWTNAPDYVLNAVSRRVALSKVEYRGTGGGVYKYRENAIRVSGKKSAEFGTESQQSVWRHEFGHAMDWGTSWKNNVSLRQSFRGAMDEDRLRLRKKPHEYGVGRAGQREDLERFVRRTSTERAAAIAEAMDDAGLDESAIREFIKRNSLAGREGVVKITDREIDALVWQFAKFWKADDPVGLLLVLSGNWKNFVFKALKWDVSDDTARGARALYDYYRYKNNGTAKRVSDLMDALTYGTKRHLHAHSEGYYRKAPDYRPAEVFANLIAVLGSGPMGERLLMKVAPSVTRNAIEYLKSVK